MKILTTAHEGALWKVAHTNLGPGQLRKFLINSKSEYAYDLYPVPCAIIQLNDKYVHTVGFKFRGKAYRWDAFNRKFELASTYVREQLDKEALSK